MFQKRLAVDCLFVFAHLVDEPDAIQAVVGVVVADAKLSAELGCPDRIFASTSDEADNGARGDVRGQNGHRLSRLFRRILLYLSQWPWPLPHQTWRNLI